MRRWHRAEIVAPLQRNVRTGCFEREQFERVLDLLPTAVRPVVRFAYITGWRIPSEVLPLQWRHIDFEARVVRLDPHTTKNDEGRTFPFTDALQTRYSSSSRFRTLSTTASEPKEFSV